MQSKSARQIDDRVWLVTKFVDPERAKNLCDVRFAIQKELNTCAIPHEILASLVMGFQELRYGHRWREGLDLEWRILRFAKPEVQCKSGES